MSASVVDQILEALGPNCRDAARRARILAQAVLNGIDFVEFEVVGAKFILHVHFLLNLPAGAYGLVANPSPIHIHGGTRIIGVAVKSAAIGGAPNILDVEVDEQGDFSPYLISIGWARDAAGVWRYAFTDIDRLFSVAPVNFRPGCPVDFDCKPVRDCPPETLPEPALDYLARDYASFRQMLIDLVAQRNPAWTERSAADVGIALLELFAHEGDHISYFQDAVANEAFLDTARQRVSAKRHAKIVDYAMHDGRNAWTFVHLRVKTTGTLPSGTQLLTKISMPMRFDRQPFVVPVPQPIARPGTFLNPITDEDYRTDPALAQVRVFETTAALAVDPLLNDLRLHTWGNEQCCLPRGTTTAHMYAIDATVPATPKAVRFPIKAGDRLLLEEVLGPETGNKADADPAHRCVVRVVSVNPDPSTSTVGPPSNLMRDRLFLADLDPVTFEPKPVVAPVPLAQTLPLVEVTWRVEDAPKFALCLAAKLEDGTEVHTISVARGNIALADHGRTKVESYPAPAPSAVPGLTLLEAEPDLRLRLGDGPLTMCCPTGTALDCDVRAARPAVSLVITHSSGATEAYIPVADLLSSKPFMQHFVADVDNVGRAVIRFGDGEYGRSPVDVAKVDVTYRVGNGRAGNIGADSLAHVVRPAPPPLLPDIEAIRNPLPARRGEDPELIDQVRNYAPAAFRAGQLRAVTELDYKKAALTIPGVWGAVASFRWTGSWYTVFVGIDPADPELVITDARGHTRLEDKFKRKVHDALTRYRLAGYDLEIRSARYIPLDIAIQICVKPGYFRGDVAHAVSLALSAGVQPGGKPGLFNPANFTFGQPVYLSRIYEAVEDVEGVDSATVTVFHPHARDPANEIDNGRIPIGAWEIARLDNDPSNMENGTLTISAGGGS
jgi:hypothetical protein